jgi:hypothetical protein
MAATIEAKLSSVMTICAASLVAAALAHGHADVGGLQGRRVVDAVTRHRHDLPEGFEARDDGKLVSG